MHLYNNIFNMFGKGIKKIVWAAAGATTDYFFNKHMDNLKKMNMRAHKWLAEKPRSQWSRSGFRDTCKSDMFVNHHCESFNNAINKFREMGIITMFKAIHISSTQRIQGERLEWKGGTLCYVIKLWKNWILHLKRLQVQGLYGMVVINSM